MSNPTYYIAYGSNLNLRQMSLRCPTATTVGTTELRGFDLLFRGHDGSAVATVEPGAGIVPVLVWQIEPRDERSLDRYEGWPSFYRKESMTVSLGGQSVEAIIYLKNGGPLGQPGQDYFDSILEGYDNNGFDDTVLFEALDRSAPELGLDADW